MANMAKLVMPISAKVATILKAFLILTLSSPTSHLKCAYPNQLHHKEHQQRL